MVYMVVLNQGFSGLVVAAVIKYADNILKGMSARVCVCMCEYVAVP
jgi:hypothetical protein